MYRTLTFIFLFCINPLYAKDSLTFKKELVTNVHWFPYSFVLIILLLVLMILAKYSKKTAKSGEQFKFIEKMAVHNKTNVYVIDYQGQRFLIADNQNALAIHAVHEGALQHE